MRDGKSNLILSTELNICEASKENTEMLESLFRSAFTPYVHLLGRRLSENAYDWLPESIQSGNVWFAQRAGKAICTIAIIREEKSWTIDQVAVHPEMQGNGLGSQMLNAIVELARRNGIETLTLDTAKMMTDLVRLYEKHGFRVVKEGKPNHNKDDHIRVFMEKSIIQK